MSLALHPNSDYEYMLKGYYADPILFCRQILPEWFPEFMPWFARGILAIMLRRADFLLNFGEESWADGVARWTKKDFSKLVKHFVYKVDPNDPNSPEERIFRVRYDESGRKPIAVDMVLGTNTVQIIPRGFTKTTLAKAVVVFKTLFKESKFWIYASETEGHAAAQLDHIKRELETNERIIKIWGNLRPERSDAEKWSATEIETLTGVKGVARGRGQQIRGMNRGGDRPDFIILDDIDNEESVRTEDQRDKSLTWVVQSVLPALTRFSELDPSICMLGTLLHAECTIAKLSRDSNFTSIVLGAVDRDGEPLWSGGHGLSLAALAKKRAFYASLGKLYEFCLEYLSEVRDEGSAKFKKENITYHVYERTDFIAVAIALDPAISEKKRADMSAIGVVGVTEKGQKHVLECWLKRGASPAEQVEKYFELSSRWDCTRHGVEAVAYQKALVHMIHEQMFRMTQLYGQKAYFEIDEIYPGKVGKNERVEGILCPLYNSRWITHQRIFPELESQLLDWPRALQDGPDVIAMCCALLEPFAPLAIGKPEELMSDETYEALEWEGGAP